MLALLPILLELLPSLAPLVAGGKAGAVVAAGTRVAQEVFGHADADKVAEALKDPATAESFKAKLEAETAQLQAELSDVQDARHQTVELVQAGSALAWAPAVLSGLILTGFLGITGAMLFKAVPDSQVAMILFGQLAGMTGGVVQFWLGSSQSSRAKDQQLAAVLGSSSLGQAVTGAVARVVKRVK